MSALAPALALLLGCVVAVICLYTARHYLFTVNRLFGRQRHPYVDVLTADWPRVTVFVAAHNEEAVIDDILGALLEVEYPPERLRIVPVNDRSTDGTAARIDAWAARFPGRVVPFHRGAGAAAGKAAALKDATRRFADDPIVLVFDADYVPGRGLVKQLVAPFFDPEVGAVMGRVVPLNVSANLLTRLLDLERTGGYQVDQQARMNLHLVPQYGGTVGGVRTAALAAVGGWRDDTLAEDTDLTYRLLLGGWETVYQNRSECYEEVPQQWPARARQITRWARGHNQAAFRYTAALLRSGRTVPLRRRVDGLLLLGVFLVSPLLGLGWCLALALYYIGYQPLPPLVAVLLVASYNTLGNFAAFFEVAAGAWLDGSRQRIRLLPFLLLGFLVSLACGVRALLPHHARPRRPGAAMVWEKTERYRVGGAGW